MSISRNMMKMTPEDEQEHGKLLDAIIKNCNQDMSWTESNSHQQAIFRYLRRCGRTDEEIQSIGSKTFDHPRPSYRSFGPSGWRNVGPDDSLEPKPHFPSGIGKAIGGLVHDVMEYYQAHQIVELAVFDVQDWVKSVQSFVGTMKSTTTIDSESLRQYKSRLEQLAGGDREMQVRMVGNLAQLASQRRYNIHQLLNEGARLRQSALSDADVSLLFWLGQESTAASFAKQLSFLQISFPLILNGLLQYQNFLVQCEDRLQVAPAQDQHLSDDEESAVDGKDQSHADEDEDDFHDTVEKMSTSGDQVQDEIPGDSPGDNHNTSA